MYKSAVHLLEDLHAHIKLLHTPERAQASKPAAPDARTRAPPAACSPGPARRAPRAAGSHASPTGVREALRLPY